MALTPEQIADAEKGAKALHTAIEEVKSAHKKGEEKSAEFEGKIEKLANEMADVMEANQKLIAKNTEIEKHTKELEISIARNTNAKAGDVDRAKELQHEAMELFIRKGAVKGTADKQASLDNFLTDFLDSKKLEMKDFLGSGIEVKSGTSLRVSSDVDGGFLVLPEFGGIVQTQVFETSPLRGLAGNVTIATDEYTWVDDYDQVTSGWVGETDARTATQTPQVAKRIIATNEQYALTNQTQKMLEDGIINVESWVTGKISDKFARTENTAFVTGDGIGKPRGFTTYTAGSSSTTYVPGTIQTVNSGSSGAFLYAGLIDLVASLKAPYFQGATFAGPRQSLGALLKIVDGQSRPIFNMAYDKNTNTFGNMLGIPIAIFNDIAVPASGSLSLVLANFKQAYMIVDRRGISMLRDPYSNKPYVQFYATKRVGGDVANWEAIKIHKLT